MGIVSSETNSLKATEELRRCLEKAGTSEHFSTAEVLFRVDGENTGVYLVRRGRVRMSVKDVAHLDRVFPSGSVLGLPSTFTGQPYSLTAVSIGESEVVRIPREQFLLIMRDRIDLCREATDMLSREVTFIQSALAEQRRQLARPA